MSKPPLSIVSVEQKDHKKSVSKKNKRDIAKANFERMWLASCEKFDPTRNQIERERISRTWKLILDRVSFTNLKACDLGCGMGLLSFYLAKKDAHVDAVDISSNALNKIKEKNDPHIDVKQDYVPKTVLADDAYDLVMALDLIAYLDADDYRLFFAELARIVKSDGWVIASTPIDFRSENALEIFDTLAETEFDIDVWMYSYHAFYIKLIDILKAPMRFAKAGADKKYRIQGLKNRFGLNKQWFRINSVTPLYLFWKLISYLTNSLYNRLNQSEKALLFLENLTQRIKGSDGISHAIFIGKRRPIIPPPSKDEIPIERKTKKQIWE